MPSLLVGDGMGVINSFSWLSLAAIDIVAHGDICEELSSIFFCLFDFITFLMKVRLATIEIEPFFSNICLRKVSADDLDFPPRVTNPLDNRSLLSLILLCRLFFDSTSARKGY